MQNRAMLSIASWDSCDSSIFFGFWGVLIIVTYTHTYLILCTFRPCEMNFDWINVYESRNVPKPAVLNEHGRSF